MTNMKRVLAGTATAIVLTALAVPAHAGTLENMERERAIMIETLLSGDIDNNQRQVHASVEKNRSVADHWLSEIGLSTQAVMNARTGRR